MATRSNIGIMRENGEIETIYSHWDGYLEHNGCMLFNYYNTAEKVEELISKGYISALGKTISESEIFDRKTNSKYESLKGLINNFKDNYGIEYIYIFFESEKKWYFCNNHYYKKEFKCLKKELEELEKEDKDIYIYRKVMATGNFYVGEAKKEQSLEEFLIEEYKQQSKSEDFKKTNYIYWIEHKNDIMHDYEKIPESYIKLDDTWYTNINIFEFAK